jgi:DNA-binding response OmpR family regulator
MSQKRILLIEDEQDMAVMVGIRLESAGYYVCMVADGKAGLEAARQDMPDLIVLDLMLPGIDGYEICSALKNDEKYSKIPIVILTAMAQKQDIERGLASGADAYMVKPFDPQELLAKVAELIEAQG